MQTEYLFAIKLLSSCGHDISACVGYSFSRCLFVSVRIINAKILLKERNAMFIYRTGISRLVCKVSVFFFSIFLFSFVHTIKFIVKVCHLGVVSCISTKSQIKEINKNRLSKLKISVSL